MLAHLDPTLGSLAANGELINSRLLIINIPPRSPGVVVHNRGVVSDILSSKVVALGMVVGHNGRHAAENAVCSTFSLE